jgi:hypothetical protein
MGNIHSEWELSISQMVIWDIHKWGISISKFIDRFILRCPAREMQSGNTKNIICAGLEGPRQLCEIRCVPIQISYGRYRSRYSRKSNLFGGCKRWVYSPNSFLGPMIRNPLRVLLQSSEKKAMIPNDDLRLSDYPLFCHNRPSCSTDWCISPNWGTTTKAKKWRRGLNPGFAPAKWIQMLHFPIEKV